MNVQRNPMWDAITLAVVLLSMATPGVYAQPSIVWTGDGDGLNWSDDDNWLDTTPSPGGSETQRLFFRVNSPLWVSINDLSVTYVVNDIIFNLFDVNSALATLEGNPITFDGSGRVLEFDGVGSVAISNSISFTAGEVTTVRAHNTAGANAPRIRLNGNLSDNGGIRKEGAGRLVFNGSNGSWTGSITLVEGTAVFEPGNQLGAFSGISMFAGTTADFRPEAEFFGALNGTGEVLLGTGEVRAGTDNSSMVFEGTITGSESTGMFTKAGLGTMILMDGAQVNVPVLRSQDGGMLHVGTPVDIAPVGVVADDLNAVGGASIVLEAGGITTTTANFSSGSFSFLGGTFSVEQYSGSLLNQGGTLAPGNTSPVVTTIVGDYDQLAPATLHLNIVNADLGPGAGGHDQLIVDDLTLAGTLDVDLFTGFGTEPDLGEMIPIILASTVAGTFDTIDAPVFDGLTFDVMYNPTSVVLQVVEATDISGDYNNDGTVDAADYVVWRKNDGTQGGYDAWRANFGQTAGVGAASRAARSVLSPPRHGGPTSAVPEPSALCLALATLTIFVVPRGGVKKRTVN